MLCRSEGAQVFGTNARLLKTKMMKVRFRRDRADKERVNGSMSRVITAVESHSAVIAATVDFSRRLPYPAWRLVSSVLDLPVVRTDRSEGMIRDSGVVPDDEVFRLPLDPPARGLRFTGYLCFPATAALAQAV